MAKFSQKALAQRRYLLGGLRVTLVIVHPQMLLGKVQEVKVHHGELAEFQIIQPPHLRMRCGSMDLLRIIVLLV